MKFLYFEKIKKPVLEKIKYEKRIIWKACVGGGFDFWRVFRIVYSKKIKCSKKSFSVYYENNSDIDTERIGLIKDSKSKTYVLEKVFQEVFIYHEYGIYILYYFLRVFF